jgi:hypothetical protein
LIQKLRQVEAAQRYARPDLWQSRLGFFRSRERRHTAALALVDDWVRLAQVDPQNGLRMKTSRARFWLAYWCGWLPWLGGMLRAAFFHHGYRSHLMALVTRPAYLKLALLAARSRDLAEWSAQGRVSRGRLARLERSTRLYCLDRLSLGWLPARLQRILSDRAEFQKLLSALVVHPLRLLLRPDYRFAWLRGILEMQQEQGLISASQQIELEKQLGEPHLASFSRDLGITVGLEVFSKTIYGLLAAYGLSSGDFLPLALAVLGPVPPSGVIRAGYVAVQLAWELPGIWRDRDRQLLVSRLLGLAVAPWRWVGNLFAPLEMFSSYPDLSLLMAEHFVVRMVRVVPVLGGPGLLLEYWAFQAVYNLPLSLRRWLAGRS